MEKAIPTASCDIDINYLKEDAYKDHMRQHKGEKSNGIMACYCRQETTPWAPWVLIPHNFKEFSGLNPNKENDQWNYCAQYWVLLLVKYLLLFFI